ncbi:sigma-70 family RNA polymerase sigma factor [Kineococcus sp. NPDC059986]|uniref:RNA polymerase sigma factor n=1 Tax=Kineococcus sp. NPDC059986 TaxID=3155538 RepID=UPI00344D4590
MVTAARGGDQDAFGSLYDRHAQLVYRYCHRHALDPSQAEDLMSVVFLEAWRCRLHIALVDGSARAWLLGVAKNVVRSNARTKRRHAEALQRYTATLEADTVADHAPAIDDRISAASTARLVWTHMMLLPSPERAVAELCLLEDLSVAQAAVVLGQRPNTVKSRLSRARSRLRSVAQTGDIETPRRARGHVGDERTPRAPIETLELT